MDGALKMDWAVLARVALAEPSTRLSITVSLIANLVILVAAILLFPKREGKAFTDADVQILPQYLAIVYLIEVAILWAGSGAAYVALYLGDQRSYSVHNPVVFGVAFLYISGYITVVVAIQRRVDGLIGSPVTIFGVLMRFIRLAYGAAAPAILRSQNSTK